MPFKSRAQQRFMFSAEARGELPEGTAERWAEHTPDIKHLPARVRPKRKPSERTTIHTMKSKSHKKHAFASGFAKAAFDGNLPEQAAEREAAQDFTNVVKGSNLPKETAQARSGYAQKNRTGESRVYPQDMRHRWRSSRG